MNITEKAMTIYRLMRSLQSIDQYFITSSISANRKNHIRLIKKNPFCSNDNTSSIEASLISFFTEKPLCLQSPELTEFSSEITPKIVETVLKSFSDWRLAQVFFNWASNQEGYSHSCYTYNAMAAILSTARQNAPLRDLAVNLLDSGISWTPGAFGYFIRCLGSQGLVKEADHLFDQVKNSGVCALNSYSYNCLLETIAKSGDVGLMESRVNEMRNFGFPIDKHSLTPLLQCYCNAREFEKACMVFNELNEKGWIDQHVLSILLLSHSKSGEVDMVFQLIEWIQRNLNINLNEKTFCVLIHGFVRKFRVDKAVQLYDKMKRVGYLPDISVYDVLIGGLCKNNDIEKALALYMHMKVLGISPDVRILPQIRLLAHIWRNLDEEKKMGLYSSISTSLINDGSVDQAYNLLKGSPMEGDAQVDNLLSVDGKPDPIFLEIIIDCLCKSAKLDMALDLFNSMAIRGCDRSLLLFNNLVDCLSKANMLDECFILLDEMKKMHFQPSHFTFNSILGCLCRRGDAEGAVDILREMRSHGHEPWIKHYTLLVKKLCERGNPLHARKFLNDMTQEGFLPDMIAYSAAINGFINTNNLDNALELFREICERGYCPDVVAHNITIKGLCKANRTLEAEDIMNQMLEKGLVPSIVTYNLLIDGWCKDGNVDQAILFFRRMMEADLEPNIVTYSTLVDGLCNAGKPDDAVSIWIEMENKGCDPNRIAYMALIHGLCKCGKPDVALVYFHEMEEKNMKPDTFVYKSLMDAFSAHSDTDMANKILEKMAQHITPT